MDNLDIIALQILKMLEMAYGLDSPDTVISWRYSLYFDSNIQIVEMFRWILFLVNFHLAAATCPGPNSDESKSQLLEFLPKLRIQDSAQKIVNSRP